MDTLEYIYIRRNE